MLKREYNNIFNPELPIEDQIDLLPYKNSWEFPKERLKFGKFYFMMYAIRLLS